MTRGDEKGRPERVGGERWGLDRWEERISMGEKGCRGGRGCMGQREGEGAGGRGW